VGATELVLLAVVALLAGGLNAVAGGGSLLLFPALLALGLGPLAANVTTTVSLWPGYVGTTVGYRGELRGQRRRVVALCATALVGGATGALLLLTTPEELFDDVVPFLVITASLLLAVQTLVTRWVQGLPGSAGGVHSPLLHLALFLGAVYGGYFGGALGVVLLAVLAVFLVEGMQRLNALKAVLSLLVNTVALVAFAVFGPVVWTAAAVAAPAALVGGYLGARAARRLPATWLRAVVVLFGLGVGTALAVT
jgi:uncharacterized membrane protein YfcA